MPYCGPILSFPGSLANPSVFYYNCCGCIVLSICWGGEQPWIWKQRSEGRSCRDKGRTHRCWRQEWGRAWQGMAVPKCLILNRMQIPPFSDTDAVRLGTVTGWWPCPERQAAEEEEGRRFVKKLPNTYGIMVEKWAPQDLYLSRWFACYAMLCQIIWNDVSDLSFAVATLEV